MAILLAVKALWTTASGCCLDLFVREVFFFEFNLSVTASILVMSSLASKAVTSVLYESDRLASK